MAKLWIYHQHLGKEEMGWLSSQRGVNWKNRNKTKEKPIICATVHKPPMSLLQSCGKRPRPGTQVPPETEISKWGMTARKEKPQGFSKTWSQKSISPSGHSAFLSTQYLRLSNLFSHRALSGLGFYMKTVSHQLLCACTYMYVCTYTY